MCRTVSDAVHLLDAIVGYDEFDAEATGAASKYIPQGGYTQFLRIHGLRGKRIGVHDVFFHGYDGVQMAVYEKHLDTMRYSSLYPDVYLMRLTAAGRPIVIKEQ